MHIHDPHRVALLPVGGREEQPPDEAGQGDDGRTRHQPGQNAPRQPEKLPRIGEAMQAAAGLARRSRQGCAQGFHIHLHSEGRAGFEE